MIDALIQLIIVLVIVGFVWWAIQQLPIAEPFMTIIRAAVILIALLIVLSFLIPLAGVGWHGHWYGLGLLGALA